MKKTGSNSFRLSASDLVGHLNCHHLTVSDLAVANGAASKPKIWDPLLEVLWKRGAVHEGNYIDHLLKAGLKVVKIEGIDITSDAVEQTKRAMLAGAQIIVQGALISDRWHGRADILRRVETSSKLGGWSYEVIDTKLARETKGGTVLQLCLYSELLVAVQGLAPEFMYVVVPWSDFQPKRYRFHDYAAYFRHVKASLELMLDSPDKAATYPEPNEHCDICRWRLECDKRRRDDDHLCLVAGISKIQINELKRHSVETVKRLAGLPVPIKWKPERGSVHSYFRIREQARIQVEAREMGKIKFELLPVEAGFGFNCLPQPSKGDIFFDIEGDPFVGESGMEFLFGYEFLDGEGNHAYVGDWALSFVDEKRIFEVFVDFVMKRLRKFPDLHIYHYAPYEPSALKRLMGRYATREEEIDQMLRSGLFVDLYDIVKHSIRASVESYSIKKLEPFYKYRRKAELKAAGGALALLQTQLELNDLAGITDEGKTIVQEYNHDDCSSTFHVREWLEELRKECIAKGMAISRPVLGSGEPTERISEWLERINAIVETIAKDVPLDSVNRTEEQHARWILANILDWHRREQKAIWWEFFRLSALSVDDLMDEPAGLSGLSFISSVGGTARAPIHRYGFPSQETSMRGGESLKTFGGVGFGSVEAISFDDHTIDIKKRGDSKDVHPGAVFAHDVINTKVLADSLVRLGEWVAQNGVEGMGVYQAARDLLLRNPPKLGKEILRKEGERAQDAAIRIAVKMEGGILPIQGPPGTGKTFTGAEMICELVAGGKKVGITANSHKVIRHLIDGVIKAAAKRGATIKCIQKAAEPEKDSAFLVFAKSNEDLFNRLKSDCPVAGGTAWLWAREEALESVDVLFVDEAAQMSLANVLAVSQAGKTVVLLGDPQQLDQPMQGSHPDGTDVSALDHILDGEQTISNDKGLFLEETWRLHPSIASFTSELFYDGKLQAKKGLELQQVKSSCVVNGAGLVFIPVDHNGNQNASSEEAVVISDIVKSILDAKTTWINWEGTERPVKNDDILIITPYNAQVFELQQHLPGMRIGTVDKFQGQEAPITIYSMASSSHADAPRGMNFLYSLNRLNVATSRAKCISILVACPQIFKAECHTPKQMRLANAFCRYLEIATVMPVLK